MTGVGGFFLKGMAGGIQTGFNMGWQKKQQKMLEDKEKKITEGTAVYNNLITQLGADGAYSDDDIMQLNTAFWAAGYEVQEKVKSAHSAILTMNNNQLEQDFKWLDLAANWTEGLDPSNAKEIFEFMRSNATTDKGKSLFTAYENIYKKKYEAVQAQPTAEVFTTLEAARAKYPEAKIEFNAQAGGYVVEAGEVKPPEAPPTELDIMGETQKKLDYAYNTGNANYFNQIAKSLGVDTTFDTYKQAYKKPEAVGAEKERATSLPQLESYRTKILEADTLEESQRLYDSYAKEYDEKDLNINLPKDWADVKQGDLMDLTSVLNEITSGTPDNRNVKGKKEFTFEINGKATTKTGEEWYQQVYESYTALLKLLEEQGVDTSQYKKLKPLSEIKKAGRLKGMFTGGGVEIGDLISIYY